MATSTKPVSSTVVSADGTAIAYDVRGDGPPLIYITGATCFRRFKPVAADAKAFARDFTVLTYDRRGRGDSGPEAGPWSLDREIEDIDALIDELGGQARIYGHSSGAVLAMHAARRLGDKIPAILMYDAPWVRDDQEKAEYAELSSSVDDQLTAGDNTRAIRTFLRGIGMPSVFIALLPLFPGWKTMVALAPTLRYDIALTTDVPPLDEAAQVRVPTHVVVGERSADLHAVAERVAQAIPGSTHTVVPRQDHMIAARVMAPLLAERLGSA